MGQTAHARDQQRVSRGYMVILFSQLLAGGSAWAQVVPVPDPTAPNTLPVNRNAHEQIRISGAMPNAVVMRLFATYISTTPLSKNPCGEWIRGGDFSVPLAVTIPLDVTRSGAHTRQPPWQTSSTRASVNGVSTESHTPSMEPARVVMRRSSSTTLATEISTLSSGAETTRDRSRRASTVWRDDSHSRRPLAPGAKIPGKQSWRG
jgi:hypothetical protein